MDQAIGKTGVPLSREDFATIDRFHRRFIQAGVDLQFQSTGRPPQSHYPTYRELLLATDASGTAQQLPGRPRSRSSSSSRCRSATS